MLKYKQMYPQYISKKNNILIISVIVSLLLMFGFLAVQAASLSASLFLILDKTTYLNPEYLSLDINLDTGSQEANAILAGINFSTTSLELINMTISSTTCPISAFQTIDNQRGQASLICGNPGNINAENAVIARLTFRKLKAGFTKISIADYSSVRLSDSFGTNIPASREVHNIFIVK